MCKPYPPYCEISKDACIKDYARQLPLSQPFGGANPGKVARLHASQFSKDVDMLRHHLAAMKRGDLASLLCTACANSNPRAHASETSPPSCHLTSEPNRAMSFCGELKEESDEDDLTWASKQFDCDYLWDEGCFDAPEGKLTKKRLNELALDAFQEVFAVLPETRKSCEYTAKYQYRLHLVRHATEVMKRLHATEGQVALLTGTKVASKKQILELAEPLEPYVHAPGAGLGVFLSCLKSRTLVRKERVCGGSGSICTTISAEGFHIISLRSRLFLVTCV